MDFSGIFQNAVSIKEIPGGLFKNCVKAKDFSYAFRNAFYSNTDENYEKLHSKIEKIGEGLFTNCPKGFWFETCFEGLINITTIPIDLFDYLDNPSEFKNCFAHCEKLTGNVRNLSTLYPNADTSTAYIGCNVTQIDK